MYPLKGNWDPNESSDRTLSVVLNQGSPKVFFFSKRVGNLSNIIDLSVGLFSGAVFEHVGVPEIVH